MKNTYTNALLKHPIFQDKKLKSDADIKKIFDFNIKLVQEFITREGFDEYNWNKNDDEMYEYAGREQKNENNKTNEDEDYEEKNEENSYSFSDKKGELTKEDLEYEEKNIELDLDDLQVQYALLLLIGRIYKLSEHIILKFYLYHNDKNRLQTIDNIDYTEAIAFLKHKHIIQKDDEEQSIYLLKQLAQASEEDFLYEDSFDLGYSFLSEDIFMISNISMDFLKETVDNLNLIVQKIYNI